MRSEDDTRRHIQWGAHTHTEMLCGDQWMPEGSASVGCTKVKGHTGLHEWDFDGDGIPRKRWWRCADGRTIPPPYGERLLAYFRPGIGED